MIAQPTLPLWTMSKPESSVCRAGLTFLENYRNVRDIGTPVSAQRARSAVTSHLAPPSR
ncbi:hypothetical protein MPLA_680033 [Mesorhizobium sp. ORS 3359]|nr:hypothetical protein MPLA_680033 [Mesorhizobium sp. ORS 3359]